MFYLFVPSKWKLRLLVFDCLILAVSLVQFANHFDSIVKSNKTTQTNQSNISTQAVSINENVVEVDTQKLSILLEQAAEKMDKPTNSAKFE